MPDRRSFRSRRAAARAVALAAPVALLIVAVTAIGVHPGGRSLGRVRVVTDPAVADASAARPVLRWPDSTTTTVYDLRRLAATVAAYRAWTSTTTSPPPVRHPLRRSPAVAPPVATSGGSVNGYPCGGDLPSCCTLAAESHGNPYAVEPGHQGAPSGDPGDPWHHASGLWQFMPGTWNGYGGYPYAAAAPWTVQNDKARQVFAGGAGWGAWKGDSCYPGG